MKPETKKTTFPFLFIAGLIFICIMIWAVTTEKCGLKGLGDWAGFIIFIAIISLILSGIFLFFAAFAREGWQEQKDFIIKEEDERRERKFQERLDEADSDTLKELKGYLHRKQKEEEYVSWGCSTLKDLDEYLDGKRKEEKYVCLRLREREKQNKKEGDSKPKRNLTLKQAEEYLEYKRKENAERNKLLSEQIHKLPIVSRDEHRVIYCNGTEHWCEDSICDIWRLGNCWHSVYKMFAKFLFLVSH